MSNCTRRKFLHTAGLGVVAMTAPSCVSQPSRGARQLPFTFAQLCDPQLGYGGYAHDMASFQQAITQLNALRPDFVVICGDLVNRANESSYADFLKLKAELTVPCHCVPGNHDLGRKSALEALQNYRKLIGRDYYSFVHKGRRFVAVNTQLWKAPIAGESEPHEAWVRATLALAAQQHAPALVCGHHPLYVKTPEEAEGFWNLPPAKRQELLSLYAGSGVVAVLGGHTHTILTNNYQGMQLVNAETTSLNLDKRPLGFRLWRVGAAAGTLQHEFVPLGGGLS